MNDLKIWEKAKKLKKELEKGLEPEKPAAEPEPEKPTGKLEQAEPAPPTPPPHIVEIKNPTGEWKGKFDNYTIMGITKEQYQQQGTSLTEKANQIRALVTKRTDDLYDVTVNFDFKVLPEPPMWSCYLSREKPVRLKGTMNAKGELRAEGFVDWDMTYLPEEAISQASMFQGFMRRRQVKGGGKLPIEFTGRVTRLGEAMANRITGTVQPTAPPEATLDSRQREMIKGVTKMISLPFALSSRAEIPPPFHEVPEEEFWRRAKDTIRKGARMDPKLMKQKIEESKKKYPPLKSVPGYPEHKYVGRFIIEHSMPKYYDPEIKWQALPDEKMIVVVRSPETIVEKGMPKKDLIITDHYIKE